LSETTDLLMTPEKISLLTIMRLGMLQTCYIFSCSSWIWKSFCRSIVLKTVWRVICNSIICITCWKE